MTAPVDAGPPPPPKIRPPLAIAKAGMPEPWRAMLRVRGGRTLESRENLRLILEHAYEGRISYDEMACVPCIDGHPFKDADVTSILCEIERRDELEFGPETLRELSVMVGRSRSFHPVRNYLRSLRWDGVRRLESVADDYLGASDPLSRLLVRHFFVAAVARALRPGCKVDNCLVLVGDEGLKKSTFYRVLGGPWFKDSKVDITDRKGMMLMHSAWIYEWPEVDRMLERKHDSDVKAYVTQESDSFVPMYGRSVQDYPRSCLAVGTTNKERFITSSTGSRRWWPVPVRRRIDKEAVEAVRDQLWAEAVRRYDAYVREAFGGKLGDSNPFRWWLTADEELSRAEHNSEYLVESPDTEAVDAWLVGAPIPCPTCRGTGHGHRAGDPCASCNASKVLVRGEMRRHEGREYVTVADILDGPLGVPLERHASNAYRATNALRGLGWRVGARIRPDGKRGAQVTPYYGQASDPADDFDRTF